jgi:hypothetical protein
MSTVSVPQAKFECLFYEVSVYRPILIFPLCEMSRTFLYYIIKGGETAHKYT